MDEIDLAKFQKDYYDPHQRVAEVASKYGLNPYNISTFVRDHGLKNRKQVGIIYRPNGLPDKKTLDDFLKDGTVTQASRHFGVSRNAIKRIIADKNGVVKLKRIGGCNTGCPNWKHCTTKRPETLPCEVFFFQEEFADTDDDPVSYYRSPNLEIAITVMG